MSNYLKAKLLGLIICFVIVNPSEACSSDVDATLRGICNTISQLLKKNEITLRHAEYDNQSSFDIDSNGKVNLFLKVQTINEQLGTVNWMDGHYSFYIQDVEVYKPFECKSGKCIKAKLSNGRQSELYGMGLTASSERVAIELQRILEVLERMFGVPSKDGEPIRITCGKFDAIQPSIRVVGVKGDLFEIHQNGSVIYANFPESREWMGGGQNQLQCNDFVLSRDIVVIRLGWKNDLIMAFAFQYDDKGRVVSIWKYDWLVRDGEDIEVGLTGGDVLVQYGRKHDLLTRLCFNQTDKNWRRSNAVFVKTGVPVCDDKIVNSSKFTLQYKK